MTSTITIIPRNYRCAVWYLQALAAEWMGKEILPTVTDENLTFEFENPEYMAAFSNSLINYKI